mmetsp:Transcript_45830/g.139206  ORF Transcript_45830/g.139206 Transcript_45830/m.139206 type:complete len:89 (-) Transcript_45830:165-431(-)
MSPFGSAGPSLLGWPTVCKKPTQQDVSKAQQHSIADNDNDAFKRTAGGGPLNPGGVPHRILHKTIDGTGRATWHLPYCCAPSPSWGCQ